VITGLPVGPYELSAAITGFKTFRRSGITLEVAQRQRVDIRLEIGAAASTGWPGYPP